MSKYLSWFPTVFQALIFFSSGKWVIFACSFVNVYHNLSVDNEYFFRENPFSWPWSHYSQYIDMGQPYRYSDEKGQSDQLSFSDPTNIWSCPKDVS